MFINQTNFCINMTTPLEILANCELILRIGSIPHKSEIKLAQVGPFKRTDGQTGIILMVSCAGDNDNLLYSIEKGHFFKHKLNYLCQGNEEATMEFTGNVSVFLYHNNRNLPQDREYEIISLNDYYDLLRPKI